MWYNYWCFFSGLLLLLFDAGSYTIIIVVIIITLWSALYYVILFLINLNLTGKEHLVSWWPTADSRQSDPTFGGGSLGFGLSSSPRLDFVGYGIYLKLDWCIICHASGGFYNVPWIFCWITGFYRFIWNSSPNILNGRQNHSHPLWVVRQILHVEWN